MARIVTPIGRIVQGHPMKGNSTDMKNKPLTFKDGSPRQEFFFALAINKTDLGWPAIHAEIKRVAAEQAPAMHARPDFAWKIKDGDAPGNVEKQGFAGCYVLAMSTSFAPQVFRNGDGAAFDPIMNQNELKCGDYVKVAIEPGAQSDASNPGVFLNPSMVLLCNVGEAIVSGPSAAEVFGGGAHPGGPNTTATPPPPAAQQTPPPPAAQQTPPPPPAAAPVMTAKANGVTKEQFIAKKWTEQQLIDQGYMAAPADDMIAPPPPVA